MVLSLCLCLSSNGFANYVDRAEVRDFIDRMESEHGMDEAALTRLFAEVKKQDRVLELMQRPAEKRLEWGEYRQIFLTEERIEAGVEFWREHEDVLAQAQLRYGVPAAIIVAIIGVETFFGRISGGFPAIDTLTTLAFDYPRRAKFFTSELEQYLLLTRETGLSATELEGSYAAAFGLPQFISSSYRAYAIDFDDDGKRDLWNSVPDAAGSVANYLYRHGWKGGQSIAERAKWDARATTLLAKRLPKPEHQLGALNKAGIYPKRKGNGTYSLLQLKGSQGAEYWIGHHNLYVITRYNHSTLYAMAVFQLSEAIRSRY
jgi:membrane-bound lytic murein transglycosylase B